MTHPRGNNIIWAVLSLTLRQCITSPPMPCAQQHDIWHGLDTPEIHAPWTSRKIHKAINIHHVYVAHIMWRHRIQPWASRRRMATSTELGSPLPLRLLWTSGGLVTSSCLLWWVPSLVPQDLCAIMTSAEYDHIENVSWKCCKCNTASCTVAASWSSGRVQDSGLGSRSSSEFNTLPVRLLVVPLSKALHAALLLSTQEQMGTWEGRFVSRGAKLRVSSCILPRELRWISKWIHGL